MTDRPITLTEQMQARIKELEAWVTDLQSGMYINCVYCGHRYGPKDKVPASMADVLKAHVEQCPQHPMSALKTSLAAAEEERDKWKDWAFKHGYGLRGTPANRLGEIE